MTDLEFDTVMPGVLRAFYARVREDDLLGPIFNHAVHDWNHHLDRIGDFWSSVMLGSGRYKGDPVARHLPHAASLDRVRFDRWLALWTETTTAMLPAAFAATIQAKAARIAESLQLAVQFPSPTQKAMMRSADTD
ncbi:MAG TPA: group III truncated hemoglobin [Sphingomonas sp.]|jgi:hemoglobin|nr:group III truncated hemoglobin [Sphingomonas sp.]